MKRFFIFAMTGWMAATASAACDENAVLREWTELAQSGGFGEMLAFFAEKSLPEWPAVHSAEFPDEEKTAPLDAEYRQVALRLVRGLDAFEAEMRGEPETEFLAHAGTLLDMRDGLARHCGYVNLLLADAINRCVYVNLAARLVRGTGVPEGFLTVQEHLARFRPDTEELAEMAVAELNRSEMPDGLANASTDWERLSALWELLEPGVPVGWPGTTSAVDAVSLLDAQGLLALLARLVGSDTFIHAHLPSLVLYRQAALNPPVHATYQEIKGVLGKDALAPESMGNKAYGIRRAASAASELLSNVESGQIWNRLLFSERKESVDKPMDPAADGAPEGGAE
ncbi:MAG: hypothetical protein IJS32_08190 [Kiritimatiellae bacterium]|nr:hypothetical protein [Kiritimatiellia bacterium]